MRVIHQIEPYITEAEVQAVTAYLRSGGWLTEFRKTAEFEEMIASFLGSRFAVVVTSGTAALYLSLLALGIGPGDSVVVPDFTMIATANAVKWAGAEVILCDIERSTLCLDLQKVKLKSNTRALIYVAINGRSGKMEEVVAFCRANGLYLIEDACQAFGSKHRGRFLGTFGDVGVFSFTPHKIITTGQGGAVVTSNERVYSAVKQLKDFCRVKPGVDIHRGVGYNFKFTDLQAVIGIEQLRTIDYRINRKKEIYHAYVEGLRGLHYIRFNPTDLGETVPWFVDMFLEGVSRDEFAKHLQNHGIGTRPFYPPIHSQTPYLSSGSGFEVTSEIASRGIWLPSSINLSKQQIEHIITVIRDFGR